MINTFAQAPSIASTGDAFEAHLIELVAGMTLEAKVRLLTGADDWSLHADPGVGLRPVVLSDGPAGVRGAVWDEEHPSVNIPAPVAVASSWDVAQVERLGTLLAAEARRKGVDVLLAPTVNLQRSPYGGRHFECFSEDPYLSGRLAAAYVRGLQRCGVGATVKHFVGNDSETGRNGLDVRIDDRTLRELYLLPFEMVVRAGVWAVMSAYNGVNGSPMSESPMLREILKEEWGFDGLVMTDWAAASSTVGPARAGLDLIMPGPESPWTDGLREAVDDGRVGMPAIDDKVLRVLRLAGRVGALHGVAPAATLPSRPSATELATEVRAAAAAGLVLLTNPVETLPLQASALRRVAVIGENAAVARVAGGGSATVVPSYTVSPLDGLRHALPSDVTVAYAPGGRVQNRIPIAADDLVTDPSTGRPGMSVRLLAGDGTVLRTLHRRRGHFAGPSSLVDGMDPAAVATIEVAARLVVETTGEYTVGCSGVGSFTVAIDGETLAGDVLQLAPGADVVEGFMKPPQLTTTVRLAAGRTVDVVVTHQVSPGVLAMVFQVNLLPPRDDAEAEIARAVTVAAGADVAVVVVGTTDEVESEGFDRTSVALPGRQDELVHRVAAANPRTVVVVNTGAPVLMPWAAEVAAVLVSWFPGQEFGSALADVLLGHVEPGGRLPCTWPADERGLLSTAPENGRLRYAEGLAVGYRSEPAAAYSFGHGLGYTAWQYLDCEPAADRRTVTVRVRNVGARPGKEVVQVYASRAVGVVDRPSRWLVGFAAVTVRPGEEDVVTVDLSEYAFRHWDAARREWRTEPGTFTLHAGRSAADLPLAVEVAVPAE